MSQRLTAMSIDRVSLVDKGANKRVIALLKRDEEASMSNTIELPADASPGGLVAWFRKAAEALNGRLQPVPIAKTSTFAEVIAGQELQDALSDSWYTLQDVVWSAIYGYDDQGQSLSLEAKTALISQDLDEFKAYLLAQMANASVAKGDGGSQEQRQLGAFVRKVGKKISGSRLERLGAAAEALNSVLAEVAEVVDSEGADEPEETDVEKSELVAAMTELLDPINKRLEAIEKASAEPVKKTDAGPADDGPVTLETVATVLESVVDRLEKIEGGQAVRKSLEGQDGGGAAPVKKSGVIGLLR